jgi:hypothetical protein
VTPQNRAARRPPRRLDRIALVVSLIVAAGAVAWAVSRLTDDDPPSSQAAADDPGVEHVHGLGINPADDSLIVATHTGSFRIPADGDHAARIGDSFQDTMGFTVVGPDHFLGSGHPDVAGMQAGQPGRLGLIESTDGGATWTSLSLSGEVDFHGLADAHDQVYGWDSGTGRFMVSTDRHEWDTRSTLDLFGFAVDPDDPDHIVAAGPAGLVESTDGGRTWTARGGPQLLTISWPAEGGLWGADPGGVVWHQAGAEWERTGTLPGEPQALLATADVLYAAAHDDNGVTGIYRSTDDGRTWDLRYQDTAG